MLSLTEKQPESDEKKPPQTEEVSNPKQSEIIDDNERKYDVEEANVLRRRNLGGSKTIKSEERPPKSYPKVNPKAFYPKIIKTEKIEPTTDLELHYRVKQEQEDAMMRDPDRAESLDKQYESHASKEQSLREFCNFEEKKVVRVAPHIRRKDVICDTVDAWSSQGSNQSPEMTRYKQLIFNGTYPIDFPLSNRYTHGRRPTNVPFNIDDPI